MAHNSPILNQINSPEDLVDLDHGQIEELCDQLRTFIVDAVLKNSGHLGSNLGIVELTVAMHRQLKSPEDIILFDTGHQAYVHKILTGRREDFASLRQEAGLSGYPSRAESEHDWIENSHASTALSYAHGLALAESVTDSNRRVYAVIGDGSLTGGMAFEGLNNIGHGRSNVTIVFNDNGRSYAPTVSLLGQSLAEIRSNPTYVRRQRRLESLVGRLPLIGKWWRAGIESGKAAVREAVEPISFFEPLGIRYLGPFDGHDVKKLEEVFARSKAFDGPVLIHVLTQKGRGYGPAEDDPVKNLHDLGGMKPGSYTEAFSKTILRLGEQNKDIVAITAAMADSVGLLPFAERFPDRFCDVGIAEQHAVTSSAGMAMGGLRPVVAVYSTFMTRAFDQVNLDVGLHGLPVIFCLDRAGITGEDGPSHHGILDLVLFSKVPNMTIFCPSSYQELEQMMTDAYEICKGPCVIRWPKTEAVTVAPSQVGSGLSARKVTEGDQVCIVGVGKMLASAIEAAEKLNADDISTTVWDPRVVKPIDAELVRSAASHRLVVTIEDGLAVGGAGSLIANAVSKVTNTCPVVNMGVDCKYLAHGKPDSLLADMGLSAEGIIATVKRNYEI